MPNQQNQHSHSVTGGIFGANIFSETLDFARFSTIGGIKQNRDEEKIKELKKKIEKEMEKQLKETQQLAINNYTLTNLGDRIILDGFINITTINITGKKLDETEKCYYHYIRKEEEIQKIIDSIKMQAKQIAQEVYKKIKKGYTEKEIITRTNNRRNQATYNMTKETRPYTTKYLQIETKDTTKTILFETILEKTKPEWKKEFEKNEEKQLESNLKQIIKLNTPKTINITQIKQGNKKTKNKKTGWTGRVQLVGENEELVDVTDYWTYPGPTL